MRRRNECKIPTLPKSPLPGDKKKNECKFSDTKMSWFLWPKKNELIPWQKKNELIHLPLVAEVICTGMMCWEGGRHPFPPPQIPFDSVNYQKIK